MNRPDALFFSLAFGAYLIGFLGYILHVALNCKSPGKVATILMAIGVVNHTIAFAIRWIAQKHYPLASMYEYMGLMAWMVALGLLYFIYRYKNSKIGVIVSPVAVMLMVTASLLPADTRSQLVPALQSAWLSIHVTMVALGSGAFLISFATASLFMLSIPVNRTPKTSGAPSREWALFLLCWIAVPFVITVLSIISGSLPLPVQSIEMARMRGIAGGVVTAFKLGTGVNALLWGRWAIGLGIGMIFGAVVWPLVHKRMKETDDNSKTGSQFFVIVILAVLFSAVAVGFLIKGNVISVTPRSYLKIFEFFGPTLVLSWFLVPVLYFLMVTMGGGWIDKLSLPRKALEDLSYAAVAIAYPLYTIGALFAGAIWAEQAWGTWWSWDPKEVGALIIWLFYTGFLHARHHRQWKGERAAVLIILGMVMVFVSFFGNYFFGGLHSFEVT